MVAAIGASAACRAWGAPGSSIGRETVDVGKHRIDLTRYAAQDGAKRPTILLLHGSKGLAAHRQAYERYAQDLASIGVDTTMFSYMRPDELAAIGEARGADQRQAVYARSIDDWVSLVRGLADRARDRAGSSGRVGLLGFSLGGMVAVAAASDPVVSALAVFYAALPDFYAHGIDRFPPLLDLHGAADRSIPLSQGSRLVSAAGRLGGVAEIAVYPNQGHGFDLDPTNPDAAPARRRATAFLAHWLGQA